MTDGRFWSLVDLFETEEVKHPEKHNGFRTQIPAKSMETLTAICVYYNKGDYAETEADLQLFLRNERTNLIKPEVIHKYVAEYNNNKKNYYRNFVRDNL